MLAWRSGEALKQFDGGSGLAGTHRVRQVRVIRDYGMFDRREAPQYYPEVNSG